VASTPKEVPDYIATVLASYQTKIKIICYLSTCILVLCSRFIAFYSPNPEKFIGNAKKKRQPDLDCLSFNNLNLMPDE